MSEIRVDNITDEAGTGRPDFSNGIKTPNINGGQVGGRRNVLINGDFQVSQRGDFTSPTTVTNGNYYLDRWGNFQLGASSTVEDKGKNLRIEVSSGGTGQVSARQKIEPENVEYFVNQKVTLSAKIKSNSSNARLLLFANDSFLPVVSGNDSHSGGGTEEFLSATFDFPSSAGNLVQALAGIDGEQRSDVSLSAGDYIEIREVQLEVGDTATEFEHRSYGEELALCQRYYQQFNGNSSSTAANIFIGIIPNTSTVRHAILLSPLMRTAPSLSVEGLNAGNITVDVVGAHITLDAFAILDTTSEKLSFEFSGPLSSHVGEPGITTLDDGSKLMIDAEL